MNKEHFSNEITKLCTVQQPIVDRVRDNFKKEYGVGEEDFCGNYGNAGDSSYFRNIRSNYSEGDKAMLKNFYHMLSKAYHPDSNPDKDTSKEMTMLNRLKDEWGI